MKWACVGCGQGVDYHGNPITGDERQAWCYDCAEEIYRVTKSMGGARCRNCGNSGVSPWTGKPCGCPAGKALARIQADNGVEVADETVTTGEQESLMAHVQAKIAQLQAAYPNDWRRRYNIYNGTVANLLDEMQQPIQANEPRAMIQHFALLGMERKLAVNDGKGTWRGESRFTLLAHLRDEVMELQDALNDMLHDEMAGRPPRPDTVLSECADVALFAMFIADVVGALPPTDERGR